MAHRGYSENAKWLAPYPYQKRVATDPPLLLGAPMDAGKTECAIL